MGAFCRSYRCYSVAVNNRPELESGGKIILPPSALEELSHLRIEYPMLFEVINPQAQSRTHCGVQEFVAPEGHCYLPYWMMQQLGVDEGSLITLKSTRLPLGSFVRLQPHSSAFLEITNPRAVFVN